uniref:Venom allergen/ancylostoma secreted protein-like 5 n=1 Tax=Heligmosomoides polygyrus bakeri TaxID=375939 RepID=G4XWX2_HELBE|nr:venom allergen/ancylostoma secreted protein-like 5 [Heligmosomoides bakeri]
MLSQITVLLLHAAVYRLTSADGHRAPFGCTDTAIMDDQEREFAYEQYWGIRTNLVLGNYKDQQGNVPPKPQNMYVPTYTCSIEEMALKLADTCPQTAPTPPANYGLNYQQAPLDTAIGYVADEWTTQIENVTFANPYDGNPKYKEWANMAQATMTRFGCARASCTTFEVVICIHDVPDIKNGQDIYTPGTPCVAHTDCTTSTPAVCDDGLCYVIYTTPVSTSSTTPLSSTTTSAATVTTSTTPKPGTPAPTSSSTSARPSTTAPPAAVTTNANPGPELNQWCPANGGMLDRIRSLALDMHNYRRSQLAKGLVAKNNGNLLPPAANMRKMRYDCELEKAAQAHADGCVGGDSDPATRPGIQENVHSVYISQSTPYRMDAMRESVKQWWSQVRKVEGIGMAVTFKEHHLQSTIQWFTKMAWATTEWLGCAVTKCNSNGNFIIVCRYKPGGNIVNHVVYEKGAQCKCPAGYSCSTDEKLCIVIS